MLSHSAETGFTAEHQIEYENISQTRGAAEVADWLLFFFRSDAQVTFRERN